MKKLIYSVFTLLTLSLLIAACSGDSYEKRLKKEKKAISNYLADNGIVVADKFPGVKESDANVFYREGSTGVYFRIINKGDLSTALVKDKENEEEAEKVKQEVFVRFDSVTLLVAGTTEKGNNYSGQSPMSFIYNDPSTYKRANYNTYPSEYSFMSPSCVLPLEKGVGSGAIVDLIVPFVNGSAYQVSYYQPYKFTRMTYTYHQQVKPETPKE